MAQHTIHIQETETLGAVARRVVEEARAALDLPFIPTIFEVLAGQPDYLKAVWSDLGAVLCSREFHSAAKALTEQIGLAAIEGGWRFSDQLQLLSEQNLSGTELALFSGIAGTFARELPQSLLVARLLQRGFSGGQRGAVTDGSGSSALSQLIEFHVPPPRSGGLRVWLIYTDIRRHTGVAHVPGVYRMLSPFPGYLASIWLETKRLLAQAEVASAIEALAQRSAALVYGLPVEDHRRIASKVRPEQWRAIEETVDCYVRTLPLFSLMTTVWHRSFPAFARITSAT